MNLGNYCIYLRKSRADYEAEAHGEGETLTRHERHLLDLAKRYGYNIVAIYKEIVSGETIAARPVMQQLLHEVESGMWDGVLVMEIERLARGDTIDQGIVARAFQYSDTRIITPSKVYDPNNEFDEEYFEFGLFMSRREYKTIKRRLNAGRISSVKEGKYCGNKPPYGYERIKIERAKGFTLKPIPEQAEIVKLIYHWYVYGIDGERLGLSKITNRLNELGIPAATKKEWSPSTIIDILRNPTYYGKIRWNRRKSVKRVENGKVILTRPRFDDYMPTDGLHPAIISEELFMKAQNILSKNAPRPISSLNVIRNPLSGIIYCSKCGRAMVRRPSNNKTKTDMLICPRTGCSTVGSNLPLVENVVIQTLGELIENYKLNDNLQDNSGVDIIASKEKILEEKLQELEKLSEQKTKQYDFLEQGIYTTEIFLERSSTLANQMRNCTSSIEQLEKELEHDRKLLAQKNSFIPKYENLLSSYWEWDINTRNDVLKELIERIEYTKETKNKRSQGDSVTFTLDIFPKIQ